MRSWTGPPPRVSSGNMCARQYAKTPRSFHRRVHSFVSRFLFWFVSYQRAVRTFLRTGCLISPRKAADLGVFRRTKRAAIHSVFFRRRYRAMRSLSLWFVRQKGACQVSREAGILARKCKWTLRRIELASRSKRCSFFEGSLLHDVCQPSHVPGQQADRTNA